MLKAILDSIDSLSDELKAEYRQGTEDEGLEGKFVLDVEATSGFTLENVDNLKSAFGAKKAEAEQLKAKVNAFGDLDPAQAKAAIEKVKEFGDLDPEKEADKIAEQKVQTIKEQMAAQHAAEVEQLTGKISGRDSLLQKVLVEDAALKAIASEGGDVDLLLPHVKPAIQLQIEETDNGVTPKVTIVDAQGNPRIGDSQGKDMDVSELVKSMKTDEKFSRLFESSGHQGSGTGNERPTKPGQRPEGNPTDWTRKQKIDYVNEHGQEAYNELSATAG